MKYQNDILCLTYAEFVPHIMGKPNYDQSKNRGTITVHGRGGNGSEVLIEYESLPERYKEEVRKKYGNPYEYLAKQPILDFVKINWDIKAEQFYRDYVLPNNNKLPDAYIPKYTTAATWLNAIGHFTTDKKALKQSLNISIAAFWQIAGGMIRHHDIALPINEKKLRDKVATYRKEGYGCLVDVWRFGNANSKKVKDKVAEALLMKMLAHQHKHDDTIIAAEYNKWATKSGRDTITPQAVGYRRRQTENLLTLTREGASISYNKFSKQILRNRPTEPLMFINSDDNVIDLYFTKEVVRKGKVIKNHYHRKVAYVVMDAFNDYILGYAIGETVTVELIQEAYRNAMRHIMELTGDAYLWHEIQSDRWAIDPKLEGPLATYFKSISNGHYIPASAHVAQSKYIERAFGINWHQQLKFFPNYAGHNITAKEKMNADAIQSAKKNYPSDVHAAEVIAEFITRIRFTTNPKSGLPRQTEWLEAFHRATTSKQRQLSEEKRLQLFGITHPYPNRITAGGIRVQISNMQYNYEVPNDLYFENVNKQVQIVYDPYDMSRVLISNGKGLRFVASETERMPSALLDYKEDTGRKLHEALEFKKQIPAIINKTMDEYAEILAREGIEANSILQAGIKTKQISHDASHVLAGSTIRQLPQPKSENLNWFDEL